MNQKARSSKSRRPFWRTTLGAAAILWSLSPLLLFAVTWVAVGPKTIISTTLANLLILAGCTMQRVSLWTNQRKQQVRQAAGFPLGKLIYPLLVIGLGIVFVLVSGEVDLAALVFPKSLQGLGQRLLYVLGWGSVTFALSLLAAISYTASLMEAEPGKIPDYLDPKKDLVDLAMPTVAENLNLTNKDPRIIERERQKDGGVRFVITWQEIVHRDTLDAASGKMKPIEFTEEQKYEIKLDVRANIVSLKAQK